MLIVLNQDKYVADVKQQRSEKLSRSMMISNIKKGSLHMSIHKIKMDTSIIRYGTRPAYYIAIRQ